MLAAVCLRSGGDFAKKNFLEKNILWACCIQPWFQENRWSGSSSVQAKVQITNLPYHLRQWWAFVSSSVGFYFCSWWCKRYLIVVIFTKRDACDDKDGWRQEDWRRFKVMTACVSNLSHLASRKLELTLLSIAIKCFKCTNCTFWCVELVLGQWGLADSWYCAWKKLLIDHGAHIVSYICPVTGRNSRSHWASWRCIFMASNVWNSAKQQFHARRSCSRIRFFTIIAYERLMPWLEDIGLRAYSDNSSKSPIALNIASTGSHILNCI